MKTSLTEVINTSSIYINEDYKNLKKIVIKCNTP